MNTIHLKVEGMKCEGCENRIKNSLKLLNGVDDVICSHQSKEVTIYATKEIDIEEIKNTINDLGFEIIGD